MATNRQAYSRVWRAANADKIASYRRARRQTHPEYDRAYRESHREENRLRSVAWRAAYPERVKANNQAAALRNRQRRLMAQYGITSEDYDHMFDEQHGRCLGCDREGQPLYVDHDHVTGRVRGLLCFPCNAALGLVKDNPATLARLGAYLG